jgi:hypothetical protein
MAHPTSNVTGIESLAPEIDAKRVELLKGIVPGLTRVAALYTPNDQGAPTHLKYTEDAARALGVPVLPLEVRAPADYDSVFAPLAATPIGGLVMFTDPLTWATGSGSPTSWLPTGCRRCAGSWRKVDAWSPTGRPSTNSTDGSPARWTEY